jgi:Carboxypeptidase regulatory-like domain
MRLDLASSCSGGKFELISAGLPADAYRQERNAMAKRPPVDTEKRAAAIDFPEPCAVSWDEMAPERRARLCAACDRRVHDLAQYTAAEIAGLIGSGADRICARAEIAPDGRIRSRAGRLFLAAMVALPSLAAAETTTGIRINVFTGGSAGRVHNPNPDDGVASVTVVGAGVTRTLRAPPAEVTVGGLPPGRYQIEFRTKSDYKWSIPDVLVCAGTVSVRQTRDPRISVTFMGVMRHPRSPAPPSGYERSESGRSEIGGQLTTPDAAAIPGATVTATRLDDRTQASATSSADGDFVLAGLAPGDYAVTIGGPGLAPETIPKVTVLDGFRLPLDRELCR